jgi:hypothetical protein
MATAAMPHVDSPPSPCGPLPADIVEAYIQEASLREGVSADLLREVVRRESGFDPCAVSVKGAMGMMQIMPESAQDLGLEQPFNARRNIAAGTRHLRRLLEKYKGNVSLALAAYNAGEVVVDKNQAVPNYRETKDYVSSILDRVFGAKETDGAGQTGDSSVNEFPDDIVAPEQVPDLQPASIESPRERP